MVILKKINSRDSKNRIDGELFADAKSDVSGEYTISKLPPGCSLMPGSTLITADCDFAFLKSDNTWNWITD